MTFDNAQIDTVIAKAAKQVKWRKRATNLALLLLALNSIGASAYIVVNGRSTTATMSNQSVTIKGLQTTISGLQSKSAEQTKAEKQLRTEDLRLSKTNAALVARLFSTIDHNHNSSLMVLDALCKATPGCEANLHH